MNQILETTYRALKVIYLLALCLGLGYFGLIASLERPKSVVVSETLTCFYGKNGKGPYKNITEPHITPSKVNELCGFDKTKIRNTETGEQFIVNDEDLDKYGLVAPAENNKYEIQKNYGIEGSWREVGKIMTLGIVVVGLIGEVIRRLFQYIFFKKSPFSF